MSDEYEGMGGSYVINPKTGVRELVERTAPAEDVQPVEEQEDGTAEA